MAERDRDRDRPHPTQIQVHPQHRYDHLGAGGKPLLPRSGPSASQVLAVVTLLPVAGTLLALAGLTLVGSLIGVLVTTPLFIIFSPVIVPAAIAIGLAVTGFFTSGAFGLTGLTSLSWILNCFRQSTGSVPEIADQAKRRMADMAGYVGQKTKEVGQDTQNKAHEVGKTGTVRT
nr:oleosin [Anacardium occidentale]